MSSRVAVFCRTFLPRSQTFVYDAVTRLERYRATVFCLERDEAEQFRFDDVRVGWPGYRTTRISPNFVSAFLREHFDVIHAQFGTSAIYALPYARLAQLPLVVTFHGYDVPLLDEARPIRGPHHQYAWFSHAMLRRMTLGLCVSAELRRMLIERGADERKLRIHLLGIDTERFKPRPGMFEEHADRPVRVLMVGRMVEKKGFRYGLEAFARCGASSHAQLTMIGEGPLDAELRALVQELGIRERVHFTGPLPHAEVCEQMREHDILLAPCVVARNGDRDGGLIVLREAASCGLVPIGTTVGGSEDAIDDGVSGFITAPADVDAMAERLNRLLTAPAARLHMGRAARDKMERELDRRVSMQQLERAYDDARALHATTA